MRRLALAAALLLVPLVLLLLPAPPGEGRGPVRAGGEVAPRERGPAAAEVEALAAGIGAPTAGRRTGADDGASDEAPKEVLPALVHGRTVRVVDAADGRPLAGALVHFVPGQRTLGPEAEGRTLVPGEQITLYLRDFDPEESIAAKGPPYRADGRGELKVPEGAGLLMGRHDELWNLAELAADAALPFELALEPDSSLHVTVVDHAGSPIEGMQLVLSCDRDVGGFDGVDDVTDANGRLRLPHLGRRLEAAASGAFGPALARSGFLVMAVVHAAQPVHARIDPRAVPRELELRLPPTGTIEVRVVGEAQLFPIARGVRTDLLRVGVDDMDPLQRSTNWNIALKDVDPAGRVVYRHVGLGQTYRVELYVPGLAGIDVHTEGPRLEGQTVQVEVPVEPTLVLGAQLVRTSGEPVVETRFGFHLLDGEGRYLRSASGRTDDEGRLRLHVKPLEDGLRDGFLEWRVRGDVEDVPCEVRFPWSPPAAGTRRAELGTLIVAPAPVLVAGVVLGPDGTPLPGAEVVAVGTGGNGRQRIIADESDAEGRFELRWLHEGTGVTVHATHGRLGTSPTREVAPGERGVELRFDPSGALAGRVVLEDPSLAAHLRLWTTRTDLPGEPEARAHEVHPDGSFLVPGLAPGSYLVQVRVELADDPLVRVEPVVVPAGETCRDPRLQDLVLPALRRILVQLDSSSGPQPEWCDLYVRRSGAPPEDARPVNGFGGFAELVTTWQAVDLLVECERLESLEVLGVREDVTLVLEPHTVLTVVATGGPLVLPEDCTLILDPQPVPPCGADDWTCSYSFSDLSLLRDGRESWPVSPPCTWQVRWHLEDPSGTRHNLDLPPLTATLEPGTREHVIEVDLSDEAIAAAIAAALAAPVEDER